MRILVLTPYYAPDLGASASLYEMLCEELARLGHQVSVLCAVPHYPTGRVPRQFRGRWIQRECRNGVEVTRVRIPSLNRGNLAFRLLGFLWFQALAAAVICRREMDLLIASNPSFEIALPLAVGGLLRRTPFIYSVHEIYPDVGVKLGVFRNRILIGLLRYMERCCGKRAAYVRVISDAYKAALAGAGIPGSKIVVIGDWTDTDLVRPLPRRNEFSARWGLNDYFVVLYAGNIGPTQGLETMIEAARLLQREPGVRFVIVGEGSRRDALRQTVERARLENVLFLPFQPREILPQVLATADISVLSLKQGLGADSVPSKLLNILASGRPVIALVEAGSDIFRIVREVGCGATVEPGNAAAFAETVLQMSRAAAACRVCGENGRAYAVNFRSKTAAAEKFQELASAACALSGKPAKQLFSEV